MATAPFVPNGQQPAFSRRGWQEEGKNLFYFYKENHHVDGGEIDEQVLAGRLLYNNEDCSIKPKTRCQSKILVITKFNQQQR